MCPLNMADLRQQSSLATLRRNGNGATVDPIDEALLLNKKITAQKLTEKTLNQVDAEALQAQNERLKLEIEQEQLKEAKKGEGGGSEWQKYILEELRAAQAGRDEATKALQATQVEAMNQRLGLLQGELQRIQSERSEPTKPITQVREAVKEVDELRQIFAPPTEAEPTPRSDDPALTVTLKRIDKELQMAQWEREDRHTERMEELRLSREAREAELRIQEERAQRMDRFMTDTAPKVLDVMMRLVTHFTQGPPGAGVAAPSAVAPTVPQAAPSLGEGVQGMPCRQCGAMVFFRPEWPGVICHQCGAEYHASTPAPAGQAPAEEAPNEGAIPERIHVEGIA